MVRGAPIAHPSSGHVLVPREPGPSLPLRTRSIEIARASDSSAAARSRKLKDDGCRDVPRADECAAVPFGVEPRCVSKKVDDELARFDWIRRPSRPLMAATDRADEGEPFRPQ
jgi:hypothetical protein